MRMWASIRPRLIGIVLTAGLAGGCTGVEPALVGAAIAGAGAGIGATRLGKLNIAFKANGPRVVEAVTKAADELGIMLVELDNRGKGRWIIELRDDRKNTIVVTIDQRGREVTHTQVHVGWFGSNAMSQLIAKRISTHLFDTEGAEFTGSG